MNRRTKTTMLRKKKRMILKCRLILRGKCTPKKSKRKEKAESKGNRKKQTSRWARLIKIRKKKT